ncbi:hypothetical protein [Nocardioides stalactiti]|uniref:hypothetical protein n=1 Tax=Nocardioides stalactiti TaxID=2755356 RepID=UPI001602BB4E|nr:hypothetical protein [Nocardioides stalactiti]
MPKTLIALVCILGALWFVALLVALTAILGMRVTQTSEVSGRDRSAGAVHDETHPLVEVAAFWH